jgi:ElaB/YqjD/DUF883 family membrane-anchored ribosome-binding protein
MANDDVKSSISKDIASLQQDIARLQKLVAARGAEAYSEVSDRAGRAYEAAAPAARNAITRIRSEGAAATGAAGEHIAATTTALCLAGAIGFLAGYLLASQSAPEPRPWWNTRT